MYIGSTEEVALKLLTLFSYFFNLFLFFIFLILKSLILTCVPKHEPPSHFPPHNISLGHPHAPAPSMLYPLLLPILLFYFYLNVRFLCSFICSLASFSNYPMRQTWLTIIFLWLDLLVKEDKPYHIHYSVWMLQWSHPWLYKELAVEFPLWEYLI